MPAPVRRLEKNAELEWQEGDDHLDFIDTPTRRIVTLNASGVLQVTGPGMYWVETFGGAGAQNMTGITGGSGREWPIVLRLNTQGRVITLVHTAPNFRLSAGSNFILNSKYDSIAFRDAEAGVWVETGARCSIPFP